MKAAQSVCSNLSAKVKNSGMVEVLLMDKYNYHLFTPLLYQASTGKVEINSIAQPIRPAARKSGFEFLKADIRAINLQAQVVYADDRSISYDYLVIALGSVKNDSAVKGASEYAIPLKTLQDGNQIHDRLIESLERAEGLRSDEEREEYLNFVVIGGSTGAELAGSIVDYIKTVSKNYPKIDASRDCRIYIIEAGERLFPDGDKSLSKAVMRSLEDRGVLVLVNTRVEKIDHARITLSNGETIRSRNIFDNSGVKPNPILETIPENIVKKEKGKIVVDSCLRVPDFHNVFAIGDNAVVDRSGEGAEHVPATAEGAVEEGKYVGRFIAKELDSGDSAPGPARRTAPFKYKEKATMLSIGAHTGIAKFSKVTFTGVLGWLLWRVVHLYLLASGRARLIVTFDWLLDIFGDVDSAQMGTDRLSR
jgi:NADH:ubiquinone reductase (H+-translocating)